MTDVDVKKTVVTNTVFNMSHRIINVLVRALLAPLVIANIGLGGFGVWNLLVSVIHYPRLGLGGVQAAFQKYVSDSTATGDYARASRLLTTGSIIVFLSTLLVSIPLFIYSDFITRFLGVPESFQSSFSLSIKILTIAIMISNSAISYNAIIAGAHRLDLTKKIAIFWLILESLLILILILNGFGLLALTIPFAISELGRSISCFYFSRKILPQVSIGPKYISIDVWKDLISYAGTFHLLGILEILYWTIIPMIIMRYFGATISGIYAAATRLVKIANIAAESLMLPLLSAGAYLRKVGQQLRSMEIFTYSLKYCLFTTLPPLLFLSFFSDEILFAWTGESHQLFMKSTFLLAGIGICNVLARHHMITYRSRDGKTHDILWLLTRFVVLFTLGISFASRGGYLGLLFGQMIGEILGLVLMMVVMKRSFGVDYFVFLRQTYRFTLICIGSSVGLWFLVMTLGIFSDGKVTTLLMLIVVFSIYMVFVVVSLFFCLDRQEKILVRSLVPIEKITALLSSSK